MAAKGLYSGSFDPITNGHLAVVGEALRIVDQLVIAIGVHHSKGGQFADHEREALVNQVLNEAFPADRARISVATFGGLVVDAAREHDAGVIIRGLRDARDFDYEIQMAAMNRDMAPEIPTIFLAPDKASRHISATLVRQIAKFGGPVDEFVPAVVAEALRAKHRAD